MAASTANATRVVSVTLSAQFAEALVSPAAPGGRPRQVPFTVKTVTTELEMVSELLTIAVYLATESPSESARPDNADVLDRYLVRYAGDTVVAGLHYASPLEFSLAVSQFVLGSVSALSALIYGIKRIYGLDLEMKAHREEQRAKFEKAKEEANRAERISESDGPSPWPPSVRRRIDTHRMGFVRIHRAVRVTLKIDEHDRD